MNVSLKTMKPWRSFEEQLHQLQERGLVKLDDFGLLSDWKEWELWKK